MRNSHNNLNESGNMVRGSKDVNIMHMDAKPLLMTFLILGVSMFLFFAFLAGLGAYVIHNLDQKIDSVINNYSQIVITAESASVK